MAAIRPSLHSLTLITSSKRLCRTSAIAALSNCGSTAKINIDGDGERRNLGNRGNRGSEFLVDRRHTSLRLLSLSTNVARRGSAQKVVQPTRGRMGAGNQNGVQTAANEAKVEAAVYHMYVANKARDSGQGKYLDVANKYTGKVGECMHSSDPSPV